MGDQELQTSQDGLVGTEPNPADVSSTRGQGSVEGSHNNLKETKPDLGKKATGKEAKSEAKSSFVGQNVFTNDGNFLQRFKRAKDEKDEKDEREKSLKRKQELERRIKNRGRRRKDKLAQVEQDGNLLTAELSSAAASYLNELKQYSEKMGNI